MRRIVKAMFFRSPVDLGDRRKELAMHGTTKQEKSGKKASLRYPEDGSEGRAAHSLHHGETRQDHHEAPTAGRAWGIGLESYGKE